MTAGPVGVKVTLIDGAIHSNDSSERAFRVAGGQALRLAPERAGTTLLEPVMVVEAEAPEDFLVSVIGAINMRGGEVTEVLQNAY